MYLRLVTMDDALDLLQWKNDPDTCRNSIVTEDVICWSPHLVWVNQRLEKPGFYIIMDGEKKCGDIRFDIGKETEVSIRIARKLRGQGIGLKALRLGITKHPGPLMAKIVDGNEASHALFTHAGFKPVAHKEENGKKYTVLTRG